ncbi:MAG TPA: 5-formyltetrahydrofolate cyclo-ligase [Nitrososphaerales archaeon]|nr:5-formyltetrahydrofolate cyclo-ligase [Nitrososphaerales archaeon]
MSKTELRQAALKTRRAMSAGDVTSRSASVTRRLFEMPEFDRAKLIASYVAKRDEVQTSEIIGRAMKSGKRVIVPRADKKSHDLSFLEIGPTTKLLEGGFGVMEPPLGTPRVELKESDLVLVPVVAWDESGSRLGYGGGYFDSALRNRGEALSVGLAFEAQRYPSIPQRGRDVPLDVVITEDRTLRIRGREG